MTKTEALEEVKALEMLFDQHRDSEQNPVLLDSIKLRLESIEKAPAPIALLREKTIGIRHFSEALYGGSEYGGHSMSQCRSFIYQDLLNLRRIIQRGSEQVS